MGKKSEFIDLHGWLYPALWREKNADSDKLSAFTLFLVALPCHYIRRKKLKFEGGNMRKFHVRTGAVVTAIALSISGTTFAGPLAPGKPAGVHEAQTGDKEWMVFGGLAVVAAGILIVTAGGGHSTVPAQAITVVTPTTT